jgi:hypothetical protein
MSDLTGFRAHLMGLRVKLKAGGFAEFRDVIRPNQHAVINSVVQKRQRGIKVRDIWVKPRQHASLSTIVGGIIKGDCECNPGFDAKVTAHKDSSLFELSEIYRLFFGGRKNRGEASRLGDYFFQTMEKTEGAGVSKIGLQLAKEDLGRSGSVMHLHISEADYIDDFRAAWESMSPSMSESPLSMVFAETTVRKGVAGEFRSILEDARKGMYPPWEVHFIAWHDLPHLRLPVIDKNELLAKLTDYEKMLLNKHKLRLDQVNWHRSTRIEGMLGSLIAMQEAFPTTWEEAMSVGFSSGFFRAGSLAWYEERCRPPIMRYQASYDGLEELEDLEIPTGPVVEVWASPEANVPYRIGTDSADSTQRVTEDGSENFALVVNEVTGAMVAQWHGYCSASDFAIVVWRLHQLYNNASVTPEAGAQGNAFIEALRRLVPDEFIYKREIFGRTIEVSPTAFGFEPSAQSRGIWVDRLQRGINDRLFEIPSIVVVEQLKDLARRNGKKQDRQARGQTKDDGCVALAMSCFGHENMVGGVWRPKHDYTEKTFAPAESSVKPRGYSIDQGPKKVLRYDAYENRFRQF